MTTEFNTEINEVPSVEQLYGMWKANMTDTVDPVTGNLVPIVGDDRERFDLFSKLLKERIIMVSGPIQFGMDDLIKGQLLYLDSQTQFDKEGKLVTGQKPITMYINSPGGVIYAGLGIYDTMRYIKTPVATICSGIAMSMGSILLAGGDAGLRAALPNARIMTHELSGGGVGRYAAGKRNEQEKDFLMKTLVDIYVKHTGLSEQQVWDKLVKSDVDRFMTAQEAKDLGLIDTVISYRKPIIAAKPAAAALAAPTP